MAWPVCEKCRTEWDQLLTMLTNCPKCGATIPDAPMYWQRVSAPAGPITAALSQLSAREEGK